MDPKDFEKPSAPATKPAAPSPREARLAKALRSNLRRRKQGAAARPATDD